MDSKDEENETVIELPGFVIAGVLNFYRARGKRIGFTSASKDLGKYLKGCMIRSAFRARIIHLIKSFGKLIKGAVKSYIPPSIRRYLIILSVFLTLGGTLSYVSLRTALGWLLFGAVFAFGVTLDDFDSDWEGEENEEGRGPETESEGEPGDWVEEKKVGLLLAAVSSKRQVEEGHSTDAQLNKGRRIAREAGISLPFDPIVIRGESGKASVRKGMDRALKLGKRGEIDYLVCTRLDRIGRHLPESLYYVYELRKSGVKILTQRGETDVDNMRDLMGATIEFLKAHWSIDDRTKDMINSKVQSFREGNYRLDHRPGYRKGPDGWEREPGKRWEDFVVDMFRTFVEEKGFQPTADFLNEEFEGLFGGDISADQVKKAVQDPVYIGRPTMSGEMVEEEFDGPVEVEEPDLAFIDRGTFKEAQDVVAEISEKYSRNNNVSGAEELVKEYGAKPVVESVSPAMFMCQECMCDDCPAEMVKNGTRENEEQVWMCRNGEHQRRIPTKRQLEDLDGADQLCCPVCKTLNDIEIQEKLGGTMNYECRSCGFRFRTDGHLDSVRKADEV